MFVHVVEGEAHNTSTTWFLPLFLPSMDNLRYSSTLERSLAVR